MTARAGRMCRPRPWFLTAGGVGVLLFMAVMSFMAPSRQAQADWPWRWKRHHPACGHPGCGPDRCMVMVGWAGEWYWLRNPDQEQRVVMSLYNRYCIRCHGIDGRGVWDIPDVPDFTDPRWQASRPDHQIVNIIMAGRGAVMPMFRGTLSLDEAWAMAHYLRTFVPGTEISRPDVGRAATPSGGGDGSTETAPMPAPGRNSAPSQ